MQHYSTPHNHIFTCTQSNKNLGNKEQRNALTGKTEDVINSNRFSCLIRGTDSRSTSRPKKLTWVVSVSHQVSLGKATKTKIYRCNCTLFSPIKTPDISHRLFNATMSGDKILQSFYLIPCILHHTLKPFIIWTGHKVILRLWAVITQRQTLSLHILFQHGKTHFTCKGDITQSNIVCFFLKWS